MEQRHIYCESIRLIRIQKYYIADWFPKRELIGYFYARIFLKLIVNIQLRAGRELRFMPYIAPEVRNHDTESPEQEYRT